jgi:hypothetical protein
MRISVACIENLTDPSPIAEARLRLQLPSPRQASAPIVPTEVKAQASGPPHYKKVLTKVSFELEM